MNTKEKEYFKTQGYAWEWDSSKNIITYFKEIENFMEKIDSRSIVTSTAEMVTVAVARMYDSHYLLEEKMIRWEKQYEADQTNIVIVKRHLTKLYRERLPYLKASKGTAIFNESANQS